MAIIPRSLMNELRGAFRMLEEPFFTAGPLSAQRGLPSSSLFNYYNNNNNNGLLQTPNTRIQEEDNQYLVEADLPGVKRSNLSVEFSEGGEVLHISGTRGSKMAASSNPAATAATAPSSSEEGTATSTPSASSTENGNDTSATAVTESSNDSSTATTLASSPSEGFNYGTFSNSFRFPRPVDVSKVQAKYEDGVLRLTLPKLDKVEGRKSIEIQ